MVVEQKNTKEYIFSLLEEVCDPEIPVLSILDLGIVRRVDLLENQIEIDITPTYTGCPAMSLIEATIKAHLEQMTQKTVIIKTVLSPAWTTDWISESGKIKLKEYGIAAPQNQARIQNMLFQKEQVACPRCESLNTVLVAEFGSTACKSLYKCSDCLEPFDYFKCH